MSQYHVHSVSLPLDERVKATSLAAAITAGIVELDDTIKRAGRRAIWDTFQVETVEERVDDSTIAGPTHFTLYKAIELTVLTIDPEEISA